MVARRLPPTDELVVALYEHAGSYGQLRALLGVVAHAMDADAARLGLDVGSGYVHEGFVHPRLGAMEDDGGIHFSNLEAWTVEASTGKSNHGIDQSKMGTWHTGTHARPDRPPPMPPHGLSGPPMPLAQIEAPLRLDRRHLAVGREGRRAAPRSAIVLMRGHERPAFGAQERNTLSELLPHLSRVLRLTLEQENQRLQHEWLWHVVERLDQGVMLVDAEGHVLHANKLAESLADAAHVLHAGCLRPRNCEQRKRLEIALRQATDQSRSQANSLVLVSGDTSFVLHVWPVPRDTASSHTLSPPMGIVVTLSSTKCVVAPLSHEALNHLGLTPAEFRLCQALDVGKGLKACAQEWALSYDTLRCQLKSVFAKTGTHRQSELLAFLRVFRKA